MNDYDQGSLDFYDGLLPVLKQDYTGNYYSEYLDGYNEAKKDTRESIIALLDGIRPIHIESILSDVLTHFGIE